jgi:hypothetical protein
MTPSNIKFHLSRLLANFEYHLNILRAGDLERSKDRSSNLIYRNFRRFFVILDENLYPTAPRPLFSCIDHTITSRLILSLHRKGQET